MILKSPFLDFENLEFVNPRSSLRAKKIVGAALILKRIESVAYVETLRFFILSR